MKVYFATLAALDDEGQENEFDNYEEAKECYDEMEFGSNEHIYKELSVMAGPLDYRPEITTLEIMM